MTKNVGELFPVVIPSLSGLFISVLANVAVGQTAHKRTPIARDARRRPVHFTCDNERSAMAAGHGAKVSESAHRSNARNAGASPSPFGSAWAICKAAKG